MSATVFWLRSTTNMPLAELITPLSALEKSEYEKIKSTERQRHFLLSRALLRQLLSPLLKTPPATILFTRQPSGRLALAQHTQWHISVSHSADLIAVMASPAPCGVDIETPRPLKYLKIATRYFSHAENTWLAQQSPTQQIGEFYKLWTLKEASVKALQQGLANNLSRVAFDLRQATQPTTLCEPVENLHAWQLLQSPFFLSAAINSPKRIPCHVYEITNL